MAFKPIKKKIVLGIDDYKISQSITIKRGYLGTLQLVVTFFNKDGLFIIPEGTTAKVRMIKQDKKKVLNNAHSVIGNEVTINITDQMQSASGDGSLEVILFNEGETLTSSTCGITVLPNVHDDSGLESTDEWLTVLNTLAEIEGIMTEAESKITEIETAISDSAIATQDAIQVIQDVSQVIVNANEATDNAIQATDSMNGLINDATIAILNTNEAATNANDGADRANQAADNVDSILLGSIATDTTLGVVKGGDIIIESDGTLNLPSNSVLLEDTEEPLEPEIPTDTDLLGGHPASYFDNKITSNTNSINTINTNLSKWHFYHTVVDFAGSVYIDIAIPNITITVPVFVTNADQASGGVYITGTTIPATGTLRIYLNTAWPGGLRISIFWYL